MKRALILVAAALGPATCWAAEPHGSIDFGGQAVRGDTHSSKFHEYTDVARGFYVDRLSLDVLGDSGYLRVDGTKPGLDDQRIELKFGTWGLHRVRASWDQIPHVLSDTAQSQLFSVGNGRYILPDRLQTDLQGTNTATPGGQATAKDLLLGSPFVALRTDRRKAAMTYEYNPTGKWRFSTGAETERREGGKPLGVSYGHGQIQEVVEPVDYWTNSARVGAEYVGQKLGVNAGYQFSSFDNRVSALTVDNPFQLTDTARSASGGSTPGTARFALAPDNQSHLANAAFNAALSRNTRLTVDGALGAQYQNAAFVPATGNTQLLAIARYPALPQKSYDGKIYTINGGARLNWKPGDKVSVNLKGRYYDVNNKSPELLIEQVPYDGSISTGTPTTAFNPTRLRRSLPIEYRKTNLGGDVYYALARPLSVKLAYDHERMQRHYREARVTDEDSVRAAFNLRGPGGLTLRPSGLYARKVSSHYSAEKVAEEAFPLGEGTAMGQLDALRKYDEAGRTRRQATVRADWDASEALNLGVDYGATRDDFDSEYGLLAERSRYASVDGSLQASSRLNLYAAYTWEQLTQATLSRYRATGVDTALNDWEGTNRDTVNTIDANATYILKRDKLDMDVGGTVSAAQGVQRNRNPNAITTASAAAVDLPRTKNQTSNARVGFKYHWLENLTANLSYQYQRYTETDWSQDSVDVYQTVWNKSVFLGSTQGNYTAHLVYVGLSLVF